jgi:hypothetical protein
VSGGLTSEYGNDWKLGGELLSLDRRPALGRNRHLVAHELPPVHCLLGYDLGHSANRTDQRAVTLLEQFRAMAGETRRSEFETLDPCNLSWPTSIVAQKKGIPPETPFVRVWSRPTGLLDLKGLH